MDELRARLNEAEHSCAEVVRQACQFQSDLDAELRVFQSQRAWALMLAARAVYAAFRRRGLISAADAVRGLLFQPSRRRLLLAAQELSFPRISDYMSGKALRLADSLEPAGPGGAGNLCELPLPRQTDIVILAIIDFDFRFQRPQQVAVELAARGHRVFWVSPGRVTTAGSPVAYRTRLLRNNLWEVRLRTPAREPYRDELDETARQEQTESLRQLCRDMEISDLVLMVQLPYWRRLALNLRELSHGLLVYDCMDDWDPFPNISDFIRSEEQSLVREADLVLVSAAKLEQKFKGEAKRMALVRNGADYQRFQNAASHPDLAAVPRPIVGYFGAIADWMDLDLLEEAARRRPQYSFVLVGQVFERDVRSLEKLPNVHFMGNRPYEEMPAFLASFDVCTIPFLVNEVTQATDPVKLYEYFSGGKPVVATRMGELEIWGDAVYLADSCSHYVELLDRAASESSEALAAKRRGIAKSNTWAERVDVISRGIREARGLTSIVVVTHNSAPYLALCLESVLAYTEQGCYELIVVDNASTDGTLDLARSLQEAGAPVRIIQLDRNCGFAAGNNRGAEAAGGEFLVLLNPDTVVTPRWLARLRWHLEDDAALGLICPVTNFAGNEARIETGYRGLVEMETFSRLRAKTFWRRRSPLSMAPLFCGMMKADVYRRAGGLDESYGLGMFEDDDFARRILQLGKTAACAEDCFVHHFGQGSFGQLKTADYEDLFERNRLAYERRWNTRWTPHVPREGVRPVSAAVRHDPAVFAAEWKRLRNRVRCGPEQTVPVAGSLPAHHPEVESRLSPPPAPRSIGEGSAGTSAPAEMDPHQREIAHWIDTERRAEAGERQRWLQHPRVAGHYLEKSRIEDRDWREWVRRSLGRIPRRVLELGCGDGAHLYKLAKEGYAQSITGLDLEESRFAATAERCRAEGIDVSYMACDVNRVRLPEISFDLICGIHCVHHFERLEHIFEECNRALADDGFVVFEEYVGPNRFQWTEEQLKLTRLMLGLLPEQMRIYPHGMLKNEEGRSTVEQVIAVCPSEAIRSEDIVPLFGRFFNPVVNNPLGGTIQQLLYNGIIQNFPDEDPNALHFIDCINALEQAYIGRGILPSDFVLLVGRKKKRPGFGRGRA
ncbi:MAG: glycosyltransferase [Bryobacterales bacterium]|nr:glycosyltransferase [Bryobacterales bacterium]